MTTVVGPVRFRSDGTGEVKVFFQQWLKGKQELVWPKEFATAPFGYPAPPFNQRKQRRTENKTRNPSTA